jgi:hypothetical protein
MFSTLDSQPQEWLLHDPELLHTLSICCFRDSASARQWIDRLVPRDKNGQLLKWSSKGRTVRTLDRRTQFANQVSASYDQMDFSVHCISSREAQISQFAQAFFLQNNQNITQELDSKGRNCLVFKITQEKTIKMPVLRAAKLLWIYFCVKYMKEVNDLTGFIFSDWFSADVPEGEDKALGVSFVNFLLAQTGINLQLSIAHQPSQSEADLLSDWFAGWSNSSKGGTGNPELTATFNELIERAPQKIDWIMFACNIEVTHG